MVVWCNVCLFVCAMLHDACFLWHGGGCMSLALCCMSACSVFQLFLLRAPRFPVACRMSHVAGVIVGFYALHKFKSKKYSWHGVTTRNGTTSAPGLAAAAHIAMGLGSPPPHLRRDCAHPRNICAGTALTLAHLRFYCWV